MTITYLDIMERCKNAAKDLTPDLPKEDTLEDWVSFLEDIETLQEEAYEKASEEVGSWDWCIYTYQGFEVYNALDNSAQFCAEQEWSDCGGYEAARDQSQGPYEIACAIAYFALARMLSEEIDAACDDLIELANNQIENLSE